MDALHILVMLIAGCAVWYGTRQMWPVLRCAALDVHHFDLYSEETGLIIRCDDCGGEL